MDMTQKELEMWKKRALRSEEMLRAMLQFDPPKKVREWARDSLERGANEGLDFCLHDQSK